MMAAALAGVPYAQGLPEPIVSCGPARNLAGSFLRAEYCGPAFVPVNFKCQAGSGAPLDTGQQFKPDTAVTLFAGREERFLFEDHFVRFPVSIVNRPIDARFRYLLSGFVRHLGSNGSHERIQVVQGTVWKMPGETAGCLTRRYPRQNQSLRRCGAPPSPVCNAPARHSAGRRERCCHAPAPPLPGVHLHGRFRRCPIASPARRGRANNRSGRIFPVRFLWTRLGLWFDP